jgi:hypothetical protein
MRIALHNGPYANQGYEVVSTDEAPSRIMYPFSRQAVGRHEDRLELHAHIYSLQSMRGSQTSWAYVYSGVQPLGQFRPTDDLDRLLDEDSIDTEVSDIVSLDGAEIEAPKRPRGRPRTVTV